VDTMNPRKFLLLAVALAGCTEIILPDPPMPPSDVAATLAAPTTVHLAWTPRPASEHISSYLIYRNGNQVAESSTPEFTDANLAEVVTLNYSVASKSVRGETSAQSTAVSVTTRDATPPRIIQTFPANGAGPIKVEGIPVVIVFSEPIDSSTINDSNIKLHVTSTGEPIRGRLAYVKNAQYAQFTPTYTWPPSTSITVIAGAGIKDMSGNSLSADYSFAFTTTENVPPTVIATTPANGAINVPSSTIITITFSEPMNTATVFTRVSNSRDGLMNSPSVWNDAKTVQTMTIGRLASFRQYTVSIGFDFRAEDLAGNQMAPFSFSFTSEDNGSPRIISSNPASNQSNVDPTSPIIITFNVPMDPATINTTSFQVIQYNGPFVTGTVAYNSATNTATFTPNAPLLAGTKYAFVVSNAVKGVSGLTMEDYYTSYFTTR